MDEFQADIEIEGTHDVADAGEAEPAPGVVPRPAAAVSGNDLGPYGRVRWMGKEWAVVRRPPISEDVYVKAEALATKLALSRGLKDPDGKRVERSKRYARWRYRGYLAGEVASL